MACYEWAWQLARILIPSAIVAFGWFFVSRDNDKRETRKERRQFLDRTIESVSGIRDDAVDYFQEAGLDAAAKIAARIDPALFKLEKTLFHLNLKDSKGGVINSSSLRQAITGHNCYRADGRRILKPDDRDLYRISEVAEELILSLEEAYKATYQK